MYVLFWFRKSGAIAEIEKQKDVRYDRWGSICCRVTIETRWVEIGSTHIEVQQSAWDAEYQRLKGNNYKIQNKKLEDIKAKLERIFELLQLENDEVTAEMVKEIFLEKKRFRYSIAQLVSSFFDDRNAELKAGLIATATMEVQRNYSKNFEWAVEMAGLKGLMPHRFDEDSLGTVRVQLQSKGLGTNHVVKHLKWVKQLWRWSLRKKRIKQNLLDGVEISAKGVADPDTTHLSVEQLEVLIHFDFMKLFRAGFIRIETAEKLDRERDAFVFSCFTGMHHADYTGRKYWVEVYRDDVFLKGLRKKTNKEFSVKLLEPALAILRKYGGEVEKLPIKSNQQRNSSLKEMATFCRIPVLLSTKIARKTFANFALNILLMDSEDVAACLGLTNTRCLRHYTRIKEMRIAKKMGSWDEILKKSA